jgi:toxin-antitoxin system PIN domain toxin
LIRRNLLDLNVLIALADQRHSHHQIARVWFASLGKNSWGICPLTEAGFLRVTTGPAFRPGPHTFERAVAILQSLKNLPGYGYWGIEESWVDLTAPFAARISGHQQVTDAYLLGMAIKENGVLVTFDRGLKYLAGPQFSRNLFVLD